MDDQDAVPNRLTIQMIRAGIKAFERWNHENDEVAALVAAIYYSCEDARVQKTLDE